MGYLDGHLAMTLDLILGITATAIMAVVLFYARRSGQISEREKAAHEELKRVLAKKDLQNEIDAATAADNRAKLLRDWKRDE